MPKITTIFWRDIPAQVIAKNGHKRAKRLLDDRFQEAIDRAAMRAKKSDADAHLDDWRRPHQKLNGDIEQLVEATAQQLEQQYNDQRLDQIIRNKGLNPDMEAQT